MEYRLSVVERSSCVVQEIVLWRNWSLIVSNSLLVSMIGATRQRNLAKEKPKRQTAAMSQRSLPKPQIVLCPLSQNKRQQHAAFFFLRKLTWKNCSTSQDCSQGCSIAVGRKFAQNNHIRVCLFWQLLISICPSMSLTLEGYPSAHLCSVSKKPSTKPTGNRPLVSEY